MITLLHGEDTVKSRNELYTLKQQFNGKEIRELDGKKVTNADLIQALSSNSLFGSDTLVVIENLFSGLGKKLKRIEELGAIILAEAKDVDVIIWEDKEMGKTVLGALGKGVNARQFKVPALIFEFLDGLGVFSKDKLFEIYEELCKKEPIELTHALLARRLKQLILLTSNSTALKLAPWQKTRLTNQARAFTLNRLSVIYQKVKAAEYERNMGLSALGLKDTLAEILLAF